MDALSHPTLVVAAIEVALGLLLLARAADLFVEGAAGVATAMRLSPVVIGAVIVGFGTSAPELLVSSLAALDGDLDLGVGNVVGSNVANLTLVLGCAAFIVALRVSASVLAAEAPLALMSVLLFGYFTIDGLARWEGAVLLICLVGALGWIIGRGRGYQPSPGDEVSAPPGDEVSAPPGDDDPTLGALAARTLVGLVGTVAGAQFLVWGATAIADSLGLTGGFVGFTLVAVGTSLPEFVTATTAARRGETELLLGNLLGSNMFNSLAVGGAIAILGPGPIRDESLATVGVLCMVFVAFAAWVFMVTRKRVYRLEATVLLAAWLLSISVMAA